MAWWIWFLFGVALLVVELVTPGGLFALFFGVAALVVAVLVALGAGGPAWVQWVVFAGLSVALLAGLRRRLQRGLFAAPVAVDSLVGEAARPLDAIAAGGEGRAELRGTPWSARNAGDAPLSPGQRCRVERVDGLTLWIRAE